MKPLMFLGDPHGDYAGLSEICDQARAVLIAGDLDLNAPFMDLQAQVSCPLYYIPGNHDGDREHFHDHLLKHAPERNLSARVVDFQGLRVAGLGGVFRGSVWMPPQAPRWHSRAQHLADLPLENAKGVKGASKQWRKGIPLRHRVSIYPEDFDALRALRADVLLCHDGPSSPFLQSRDGEPLGFDVYEPLARAMGASWIVHGHHHHAYEADLGQGLRVKGLAINEAWALPE